MPVTSVEGLHRGDEGKGNTVCALTPEHDIVVGYGGGTNAGHTAGRADGELFKLHVMPSGILHPHAVNVVGNGKFIDAPKLQGEIEMLQDRGVDVSKSNFKISSGAHLLLPQHVSLDEIAEKGENADGSTKSGIRFVSSDKFQRKGFRAGISNNNLGELEKTIASELKAHRDKREELELKPIDEQTAAEEYIKSVLELGQYVADTAMYLCDELDAGKRILAEGAQGFMLDIDHGLYPFTTSASTGSGGVPGGTGMPVSAISRVIGVMKSTQSHVGGGPFITKITDNDLAESIHGPEGAPDGEYGTTTGRRRQLGFLDLVIARRAIRISGIQEIVLTKLDWLNRFGDEIPVCTAYERGGIFYQNAPDTIEKYLASKPVYEALKGWEEDIQSVTSFNDLPRNAQIYIDFIEKQLGRPISYFGVGQRIDQLIKR